MHHQDPYFRVVIEVDGQGRALPTCKWKRRKAQRIDAGDEIQMH